MTPANKHVNLSEPKVVWCAAFAPLTWSYSRLIGKVHRPPDSLAGSSGLNINCQQWGYALDSGNRNILCSGAGLIYKVWR